MFGKKNRANAPTPNEHVHTWVPDGVPYYRNGKWSIPKKCSGCGEKQVFEETPNTAHPTR